MTRKTSVPLADLTPPEPRGKRPRWETPSFEEIRVSAEASAYMGAWEDQDWK